MELRRSGRGAQGESGTAGEEVVLEEVVSERQSRGRSGGGLGVDGEEEQDETEAGDSGAFDKAEHFGRQGVVHRRSLLAAEDGESAAGRSRKISR